MEYRSNTKKLWSLINQTIKECKSGGSIIPYISIDGLCTYQPKKIANRFGQFYSSIGENLASRIKPGTKEVDYYLSQMQQSVNSLVLREASIFEIKKLIRSLPNKSSHGHNRISNITLKSLCTALSYPLQIIFNQSILQGVFPDRMKLAEVIPLYNGKEHDLVINY